MPLYTSSTLRALILDVDGVLWKDEAPIADIPPIFAEIERLGLGVMIATNNSTRTPGQDAERFHSFGVKLEEWQVINSAEATAQYLHKMYPRGGPVYVVGERGLVETLEAKGFTINEQEALAVVAGIDRQITYDKINRAAALIRAGAKFIGANPDRTFPTPAGLVPGAGAILAAIEAASYVSPTIMGKPQPTIFQIALERLGVRPAEALIVGDRLETDIAGGQKAGCPVALVLSGISTREQAQAWQPEVDVIAEDLTSLLKLLTTAY
ncbi:MAG: HAD-IIA family hydrolase [Chloroflexi bacterium]|nr:HAD-IIA family hydrolase [Chloroflexota bacterium]